MYRYVSSHGNPLDISQNDTFFYTKNSLNPMAFRWHLSRQCGKSQERGVGATNSIGWLICSRW